MQMPHCWFCHSVAQIIISFSKHGLSQLLRSRYFYIHAIPVLEKVFFTEGIGSFLHILFSNLQLILSWFINIMISIS